MILTVFKNLAKGPRRFWVNMVILPVLAGSLSAGTMWTARTSFSNQPPSVDAGLNQVINLPNNTTLDGMVSDDGFPNPPGMVTTIWSQVSGQGVVTFGDAGTVDTTASFSTDGLYVLQLTTDDGALSASDQVTITVNSAASSAVFVGAGDISDCGDDHAEETATLLDAITGTVFTLGDNAYPDGTAQQFSDCYGPTWGRHKARTRPIPGNHDYHTPGASGYYNYFGPVAGDPDKGYYSYDLGDWHIIALNPECGAVGGCESDSPQGQWLQADLAANSSECILAYSHKPRYSSGQHGGSSSMEDFWQILYDAGTDVVLSGHDHDYERFAPQDSTGVVDPEKGIRQFVVGTGGKGLRAFSTIEPNSEVRNNDTFGVLKLTLYPTSYDWAFLPVTGQTFTDTGSASCAMSSPTNQLPVVEAGSDQIITLPSDASLDGTVSDDGLPNPPGAVTTSWSQVSGQGVVTFGDTSAVDTTASFSTAGVYVLQLTADDGALSASDQVTITVNPPSGTGNLPPNVDAGWDQAITLPSDASLDGTVSDDGLPGGVVTTTWSQVSGQGVVAFGDTGAVDTTASFSADGAYVLQLTADDGALSASDQVTITVNAASSEPITVEVRVMASSDDAEETDSGHMRLTSSDLELVFDGGDQTVGMRFNGLAIPQGATILNAYVQFQVDDAGSEATSLTVEGEAADNTLTFTSTNSNISFRSRTAEALSWVPEPWNIVGEAGLAQQTPNIASIIQEIVNRPGWSSGNSLVIIVTGTGERTAVSYDGNPSAAPLLHVEYYTVNDWSQRVYLSVLLKD